MPVNACDGQGFPEYAREIPCFDCRDYVRAGQGFRQTERYVQFQDSMRDWVKEVARAIKQAPPWSEEWIDYQDVDIPETHIPTFGLPVLE